MSRDPLIDIRALPPQILESIQSWADDRLSTRRFERRVPFTRFTISRDPLVRTTELLATFDKFTEIAGAAERTARQQAAQIEAESGLAVAKGYADNLKERLIRATQTQAMTERQLAEARTEIASLTQQLDALTTGMRTAEQRARDITHERDALASQLKQAVVDRDGRLQKMLAIGKRIAERAKQEMSRLYAERDRLKAEFAASKTEISGLRKSNEHSAALSAHLIAKGKKVLAESIEADRNKLRCRLQRARAITVEALAIAKEAAAQNDELAKLVGSLRAEQQRLKDETRRWHTRTDQVAHVAARFKRERDAARSQADALAADKQVLEDTNWWLQEKLRFRGRPPRAA